MSTYDPKDDPGIPGSPPPGGETPPNQAGTSPGQGTPPPPPEGGGEPHAAGEPPPGGGGDPSTPKYEFGGICMVPATAPTQEEKTWALIAHLSPIVGVMVGLPFLGPLIVWLIKKEESEFVKMNALHSLAFNLIFFGAMIVLVILTILLMCIGIGVLLIPVLMILSLAALGYWVVGAINASNGYIYSYPVSGGFVNK